MGSRLEQNSNAVRKRIEGHTFSDEGGEEYGASEFGGFGDYFRRKKIKLQNLDAEIRAASTDKPQIFKGIVAHVTGYTQPPLHVLHRQLVEHGAGFLQYLDGKTMATHIIASSLPPKKVVDFNKYRIVKPAWVTESVEAGRVLPWSDFRVIEDTPRQKTLHMNAGNLSTQSSYRASPITKYREQTDNSFYTEQLRGIAETIDGRHNEDGSPLRGRHAPKDADPGPTCYSNPPVTPSATGNLYNVPKEFPGDQTPLNATTVRENIEDVVPADERMDDLAGDRLDDAADLLSPSKLQKVMTSEEHNALLLQDPRMRKSSTANPDFIQQYYSESRLHHLSTWKADLKSRMQRLAAEKGPQSRPVKRKPGARRYILHVDFDSFFCAVSLKSAPEFVDKPTVVAHGSGNGSEIASCNYPARKHGVKNGMWMKRARELFPDLKVLPYDFPAYEEASKSFYECILDIGGIVQSVSIDEALVDATSVILSAAGSDGSGIDEGSIWREQEQADIIARSLRERIKTKTGCAVSVGIGGNILLAKVALRKGKPAGQFQIKPDEVQSILGALKVDDLPGVAYSIAGKLEEIGIKYVDDIRQTTKERLVNTLGPKTGEKLWEYARGIDRTIVGDQPVRKSVSAEVNWGIRFINQDEADEFIYSLCKELERRLLNEQVKGKQLTMKIMRRCLDAPLDPAKHLGHGKCDTFSKSVLFGVATHDFQVLGKEALTILRSYRFSPGDLRGLGVQLTKLEPIKVSMTRPDGSQKRLTFGAFRGPGSAKKPVQDPIQEMEKIEAMVSPTVYKRGRDVSEDPITDGPLTPRKPRPSQSHPALAIARANQKDDMANTPLNVSGTQFILPTNPDPAVLDALPRDIRSRLQAQGRGSPVNETREAKKPTPIFSSRSRSQSPAVTTVSVEPSGSEIPPEIDPEVFNALPDDMKAEILESYRPRSRQAVLPQSPRRDRFLQQQQQQRQSKKTTPTKRRAGPGLFARARERQADASARIVQTNFLHRQQQQQQQQQGVGEDPFGRGIEAIEELDPSFLAELPEDMREEIIADHRRRRLAQKSGLDLRTTTAAHKRDAASDEQNQLPGGQTRLAFSSRPSPIPFTSGGLTTVPEIRDMLRVWHRETSRDGPHRRDVDMLTRYLARVILEERDMDKAVKLVRWLAYLVEDDDDDDDDDADEEGEDGGHTTQNDVNKNNNDNEIDDHDLDNDEIHELPPQQGRGKSTGSITTNTTIFSSATNTNTSSTSTSLKTPTTTRRSSSNSTTTATATAAADAKSGKTAWRQVLEDVKSEVQKAVQARGLGKLDLS